MPRFERSRDRGSSSRRGPPKRDFRGPKGGSRDRSSSGGDSERDSRGRVRFGDNDRGSKRDSRGRRDFQMTQVTCSACGCECEVPFKPTSSKPVYCSSCFTKKGGNDKDSGKSRGNSDRDLDIINEKLNKIMKALDII